MTDRLSPEEAHLYIRGGHGEFRLKGKEVEFRYWLHQMGEGKPIFVKTWDDGGWEYIGYIDGTEWLEAGKKGNASHPAFRALWWYLRALRSRNYDVAGKAEFLHETGG